MNWERIIINWIFGPIPSFSSFGYFFVPGPLGDPKLVPEEVFGPTDSIENISINIWKKSQNEIFLMGKYRHFGQKWQTFKFVFCFTRSCPQGIRRVIKHPWEWFLCKNNELRNNTYQLHFCRNPSFPSFGYLFVPGPFGDPKLVPEEVFGTTDSIENISINTWKKSKNEIFLRAKYSHFGQNDIFLNWFFVSCLCP